MRKFISIILVLALCVGLFPTGAWAATVNYTIRLDFTNVGDAEGQTHAEGPGYKWEGDAASGYKLTLNEININVPNEAFVPPQFATQARRGGIYLPTDGPVTIELVGQNRITVENGNAIYCDGGLGITVQGTGSLISVTAGEVIANRTKGDVVIKDVTIQAEAPGDGFVTRGNGNIVFENAKVSINSQGTNCPVIYADTGNITIKNSIVDVSCTKHPTLSGSHAIYAANNITIEGGTVTASTVESGCAAIAAGQSLTINGGAKITAKANVITPTSGEPRGFGIYSGNDMVLSQSEIIAEGTTAAVRFIGTLTLRGIGILEPSGGIVGTNVISNSDGSNAISAKLGKVILNVPATTPTCTYGDTNTAKVTLTTTPAIASTVEVYSGTTKLGEGNLGSEITLDTSSLPAGEQTLTAKLPDGMGEKAFPVKVLPKALAVTGATATSRAYDKTNEVTITGVTLDGVKAGDTVSVDTNGLKGTVSGADAGTYTGVTLPTLTLTGAAAGNYTLTQPTGPVITNITISQTDYPGTKTASAAAKNGATATYDLTALLPEGAALGTLSTSGSGDIFEELPTVSGKTLSYRLKAEAAANTEGTITIPVTGLTNYKNFSLTITVTVTNKDVPVLTVNPITVAYTGEAVPSSAIQGTATVNGQPVEGTWAFAAGQALTAVADSGAKTVRFTPTDTGNYAEATASAAVTINKASPTGEPKYIAITSTGKTLADAALTTEGGTFSLPGTVAWKLNTSTAVTANTEYEWVFTPTDAANYNTITGKIKLWVQNTGTGTGGGGTTQPAQSVTTNTNTQGGETSTKTTAVPSATTQGGEASASVSTAMGNEIVKQAVENKSESVVISPKVTGNVTKTQVSIPASTVGQIGSQTGASLTVSTPVADVTIPNGGLGSLASPGGTVTVTAEQVGNSVQLTVTAGGEAVANVPGGVTLTVPAENTNPGTVAMLVHADGTREVVRKSVAGETNITIPLAGSAKLVITENSKPFEDVPATSWAADAAAFVSAHELFHGTAPGQFSPNAPMSRGMLAVVLHNLESNPNQAFTGIFGDVDSGQWYAEGVSWAAANGIVDGYGNGQFGPNNPITREQLAVMLWRYAGRPEPKTKELDFTDAGKASGYALEALQWAVEQGIIQGKGNGILDPKGTATRAQAAQMLMNFLKETTL